MKKLKNDEALLLKDIIKQNGSVIEMDNKRYYVSIIEEPDCVPNEDIQSQALKDQVEKTKRGILKGKKYTIDDIVDLMDHGVL